MTTQSLLFGGPAPIDAVHLPTHAVQPSKSELNQFFTPAWAAEALVEQFFSDLSSSDLVLKIEESPAADAVHLSGQDFLNALKSAHPDLNSFLSKRHVFLQHLFRRALDRKTPPACPPRSRGAPVGAARNTNALAGQLIVISHKLTLQKRSATYEYLAAVDDYPAGRGIGALWEWRQPGPNRL